MNNNNVVIRNYYAPILPGELRYLLGPEASLSPLFLQTEKSFRYLYHLPIDLLPNGHLFGSRSVEKCYIQSDISLI